jgi:hypothetical protein
MSSTTVFPDGPPENFLGDLKAIEADIDLYTGDEATHTQQLIREYIEQQSRTPAHLRTYFELDDRRVDYQRQYGLRYSFHNYTKTDIVIVDRLGLPVTIRPERRRPKQVDVLIIRREMYFDNQEVSHGAARNVESLGTLQGSDLSKMLPMLALERNDHRFGRCVSLEYAITEEEISRGDGRLYHLPTDMVISFLSAAKTIHHPCSPEYVAEQERYLPNYPKCQQDVRFTFRYVCADVKAKPKYLRMGVHVFMLQPEKDAPSKLGGVIQGKEKIEVQVDLSEYVEIIYPAWMDATREGVKGYRCHRVSIEQAREQLEIYDTLEDALNPIQTQEREKKQHKDEIAAQAAKFTERERILQEKNVTLEEDVRRNKITIDDLRRQRDVELERVREENERETHRRKMGAENIKLFVTVVTAAVTIAGIYAKLSSTKSS